MTYITRDQAWIELARHAYDIQQKRKELEKVEKDLLEELKAKSDHMPSKGGNFVFQINYRKGSVDYKAIPELQGVNLDAYRKEEVAQWKLNCFE